LKVKESCPFYLVLTLGILVTLLLSACSTGGDRSALVKNQIRVLSYNIHHGEGTDGKLDLARVAGVINSVRADLVALQEVDQNTTRTLKVDQAAELARLTGLHFAYGKAMDYEGGGYGQAILSRYPIRHSGVYFLPQLTNREPRILILSEIQLPHGGSIHFGGTHLDHQRKDIRLEQAREINRLFSRVAGPALLAGDFNSYPDSDAMGEMLKEWADASAINPEPTIPSGHPTRRIDYILYHPQGKFNVIEHRVLPEAIASDHRAVFVILER